MSYSFGRPLGNQTVQGESESEIKSGHFRFLGFYDGKVRKTVLKQHFVDVTKRKFTEVESEVSINQKKAKV